MGLFGGKRADEPEEKPQQSRVKVLNSEGKVLFEKIVLKDSVEWDSTDGVYVKIEMPDEKEVVVIPGQHLVVIEDL